MVNKKESAEDKVIQLAYGPPDLIDQIDLLTACKLITVFVRTDRFSDGVLANSFESGLMPPLASALKLKPVQPRIKRIFLLRIQEIDRVGKGCNPDHTRVVRQRHRLFGLAGMRVKPY